jgi:UDP-4-amino-4,6-dideoxy-N-acetyl-beta-L-altrosamine N-acetyltransferase
MIVLEQYGVKLVRLREKDIELVRYWRNQSDIANFMEYRDYITPSKQINWFKSINNKSNYYFIIEFHNRKVGLINSKNYNPELGFSEGGIFIWDKNYIDSFVAIYSTLCFLNFIFYYLKISKKSMARILKNNKRAIQYNKQIGYKLLPNQEDVVNQLYELSEEDYILMGGKLNRAAELLNKGNETLKYTGIICDENLEEVNVLLSKTVK